MAAAAESELIAVDGRSIEVARHEVGSAPAIILLHHGFGSVADWGTFPARLHDGTGRPIIIYSRAGCGRSSKAPQPRGLDFVAVEARRLTALRAALGLDHVILVGHSDGGSIALAHAAEAEGVAGVVAVAPHVVSEAITCDTAIEMTRRLREKGVAETIGTVHDDPVHAFEEWARVWTDPAMRDWSMLDVLPAIRCPVHAIQGDRDRCGTLRQLALIGQYVAGPTEQTVLADVGHDPFREVPDVMLAALGRIIPALVG